MNEQIKTAIANGRIVLLLGAGASLSSTDKQGRELLSGDELAKLLAEEAGKTYNNESLPVVYGGVKKKLGSRLDEIFEERFMHTNPSEELVVISKFPWARIYTLNIDDALDVALRKYSSQKLNFCYRFSKIRGQNQLYQELEYVKLNGSVDRLEDGLVFSPQEYGNTSARQPVWYRELASDYFRYSFLFIETRLNESVFFTKLNGIETRQIAPIG